jgi:serine/threonine protein kinase
MAMRFYDYTTQRIGMIMNYSRPEQIGSMPYTITGLLATTQQTHVYSAIEEGSDGDQPVVIKVARGGPCSLERHRITCHELQIEAIMLRKVARLGLPGPRFRTLFHANGYSHLVMSHISGVTLDNLSQQREISAREMIEVIEQICQIAAVIHNAGFVHHDIKPSNIMVRPDGSALLIDWGSAQRVRAAGDCRAQSFTPGFACAAQRRGEALISNDIFAIGCTLSRTIPWPSPYLQAIINRATARSTRLYQNVSQLNNDLRALIWLEQMFRPFGLSMLVSGG